MDDEEIKAIKEKSRPPQGGRELKFPFNRPPVIFRQAVGLRKEVVS